MTPETLTTPTVTQCLKRVAWQFANDPHDAEDISQECRLHMLRYSNDDDPPRYLYRTCSQRAMLHTRTAENYTKHINYLLETAEEEERDEPYNVILSNFLGGLHPADSIEDEIIKREELALIETIAATLTARQERIVLLLVSGLNVRQIAKLFGVGRSSIYKQIPSIKKAFQSHSLAAQLFTEAIPS